jgi:hypothetical protein
MNQISNAFSLAFTTYLIGAVISFGVAFLIKIIYTALKITKKEGEQK